MVNLVMLLSLQAYLLKEKSNTRLTYCLNLYHQLIDSVEYHMSSLLRLGNNWMSTLARAGLGPEPFLWGSYPFYKKRGGHLKDVHNYNSLNQQTRLNKYPLPSIDSFLYRLANIHCFSTIDLHTGYH